MDTALIISIPLLFIVSLLGSLAPFCLSPPGVDLTKAKARVLSYGNCFAGGILFATAMVHMIPEQQEAAEALSLETPIPQIFTILGFFLLVVLQYSGFLSSLRKCYYAKPKEMVEAPAFSLTDLEGAQVPAEDASHSPACHTEECAEVHYHHDHHDHHNIVVNGTLPVFLALMLSLHSALLGVALGAIDSAASITSLLIALFPHQLFESFALGVCCRKGNVPLRTAIVGLIAYSLVLPLFILIGFLATLKTESHVNLWLDVVFQGLSAGTFLFIAVLEIMAEELNRSKGNFWRLIAMIVGAAVIVGLGFIHEH